LRRILISKLTSSMALKCPARPVESAWDVQSVAQERETPV